MAARATGHIRVIDRKGGPVLYAKLKLPDGRIVSHSRPIRAWVDEQPEQGNATKQAAI